MALDHISYKHNDQDSESILSSYWADDSISVTLKQVPPKEGITNKVTIKIKLTTKR